MISAYLTSQGDNDNELSVVISEFYTVAHIVWTDASLNLHSGHRI